MDIISLLTPFIGQLVGGIGSALGLDMSSEKVKETQAAAEQKALDVLGQIALANAQSNVKLAEVEMAQITGQIDVNKAEAASGNWLAQTWRPLVGMTCASALALNFLIFPLLVFFGELGGKTLHMPFLDMNALYPLLFALLGVGSMRSFDKYVGTANNVPAIPDLAQNGFNISAAARTGGPIQGIIKPL